MKLGSMVITILPATRCHCMYVCAAVIVENKQTNKQKNTQARWNVNNELKGSEIPAQFSSF